ncbi:MAG: hypothetical protein Q7S22_08885 [Candidatus Micrarchaeota archaeon]|nr:hypothetical protein [Candidatus Micrarchaeota archaeon]
MLKDYAKTFVLTTVILLLIMAIAIVMIKPTDIISPSFTFEEAQIHKNSELKIGLKETYIYNYTANNVTLPITFTTKPGPGCVGIELRNTENRTSVCLRKDGTDSSKSNVTILEPVIFMFRPWMLAVEENWQWKVISSVNAGNVVVSRGDIEFKTIGTENVSGRIAYKVETKSLEDETTVTSWIDKEKRVILKEKGPGYEILLINANWLN